ncbi:hypothetical protein HIM_00147 [Hirsutella minnesotensis 3608]|nr:hypothetical protein HIM_00147 [Hirsutella minnesotensis 3608]
MTGLITEDVPLFTELEDIYYSVVEYIPGVGTLFLVWRSSIAYKEKEHKRYWHSVANALESYVRDVGIWFGLGQVIQMQLIYTMAESLAYKMTDIFVNDTASKALQTQFEHHPHLTYVLSAEGAQDKFRKHIFGGQAEGVHYFFVSVLSGIFEDVTGNARLGLGARLELPNGLYDYAPFTFWTWNRGSPFGDQAHNMMLGTIVFRGKVASAIPPRAVPGNAGALQRHYYLRQSISKSPIRHG